VVEQPEVGVEPDDAAVRVEAAPGAAELVLRADREGHDAAVKP
jgi:hypothetical protein